MRHQHDCIIKSDHFFKIQGPSSRSRSPQILRRDRDARDHGLITSSAESNGSFHFGDEMKQVQGGLSLPSPRKRRMSGTSSGASSFVNSQRKSLSGSISEMVGPHVLFVKYWESSFSFYNYVSF